MSQNLLYCQNQFSVQEVAKMLGRSRGFVDRRRMDIGFYQAGGRRTRGRWRVLTPCLQYYMESRHEYLGFQCVVKDALCVWSRTIWGSCRMSFVRSAPLRNRLVWG